MWDRSLSKILRNLSSGPSLPPSVPLLFAPVLLVQTDHGAGEQAAGATTSCALCPSLNPTGGRQCTVARSPTYHRQDQSFFLLLRTRRPRTSVVNICSSLDWLLNEVLRGRQRCSEEHRAKLPRTDGLLVSPQVHMLTPPL